MLQPQKRSVAFWRHRKTVGQFAFQAYRLRAEQARPGTEAREVHVGYRFVGAIGTYTGFTRQGDLPLIAVHGHEVAAQFHFLARERLGALAEGHARAADLVEQVAKRDGLHALTL